MSRLAALWVGVVAPCVVGFAADHTQGGGFQIAAVAEGTAHQALFAVAFAGDRGIAVGSGGKIVATQDAGRSWVSVRTASTPLSLLGVDIGPAGAVAVGQAGLVLVEQRDGTWRKSTSGTEERLFAVSVDAKGEAVAAGAFGTVLKSSDGGNSWQSVAPAWSQAYPEFGADPHLYDVRVTDSGVITLVGEFGLILRSTDGGANWTKLHQGDASLFALDLRADGVGYAVGQSGAILRTADGGAHWIEVESGSKSNLLGVSSSSRGRVVVTAMHDMLASVDGQSWRQIEWGDFGSAWYSGVKFAGSGTAESALAVGHAGRIVRIE